MEGQKNSILKWRDHFHKSNKIEVKNKIKLIKNYK